MLQAMLDNLALLCTPLLPLALQTWLPDAIAGGGDRYRAYG